LGVCFFLIIADALFWTGHGAWAAGFLVMPVEGLDAAEYARDNLTPVFQIHADRLFVDHERRGFFWIGLFPYLVAEKVQITIHSSASLSHLLSLSNAGNGSPAAEHRLEIRALEIFMWGENSPRLTAAVTRPGRDGAFELSAVQTFDNAGRTLSIP